MFINLNSRHFRHKWVCHQFRNGLYGNNRMPEISVNHTDLGTAILRCPFPEIRDIIWIWVQPFFIVHIQKSGISYEFGHSHSSLSISRNEGYHMSLGVAILHFQYAEIFVPDLSSFMTITRFVTRLTRRKPLVEQ